MARIVITIMFILFCRVAFLTVPEESIIVDGHKVFITHDRFLFSDSKVSNIEYVYYWGEHLSSIALMDLCIFLLSFVRKHNDIIEFGYQSLKGFLLFEGIDFLDFVFKCNDIWWEWRDIPISWNTTGTLFICAYISYLIYKNYAQSNRQSNNY